VSGEKSVRVLIVSTMIAPELNAYPTAASDGRARDRTGTSFRSRTTPCHLGMRDPSPSDRTLKVGRESASEGDSRACEPARGTVSNDVQRNLDHDSPGRFTGRGGWHGGDGSVAGRGCKSDQDPVRFNADELPRHALNGRADTRGFGAPASGEAAQYGCCEHGSSDYETRSSVSLMRICVAHAGPQAGVSPVRVSPG
jgi:hypothetical protein